jgi:hypothetical protein
MKLFSFSGTPALKLCAFLAVAAVPTAVFLPGCGGGGGSSNPSVVQRVGGTVNLNNGQFGTLGFARFSNDLAYGTFAITNGVGAVTGAQYPVGTYNVSGNVNDNTAVLRGTIPSSSLITVNVTLPRTTNGTFTVTIGDQTYTGTAVAATATPTPTTRPTTTATPLTAK